MRIASLVPHATELLFALGAGGDVLGVTHECDHPPEVLELEHLTRDVLPAGLSAQRDRRGRARADAERRGHLRARPAALGKLDPELIVTQALCPVCAVSYEEVQEIAGELPSDPEVVALDPKTLGETLGDVRTLGQATGRERAAEELLVVRSPRGSTRPARRWTAPATAGAGAWSGSTRCSWRVTGPRS